MRKKRKLRREIKELAIILPLAGSLLAISVFYNKNEPKSDFKKQNINSSIKTNNTKISLCTTTFKDTTMTVKSKTSSVDTASVIVDTTSMTTDISTSNITTETSEVSDNITDIATTELNCELEYTTLEPYTENNYETETTCVYEMYEPEVIYESEEVVIEENYDIEYSECNGETTSDNYLTDYEYIMLCNTVAYEAGSDWIPTSEKAKVAEVIMNRVNSSDFPNTIYDVLTQEGQFVGVWNYVTLTDYSYKVTEDVKSAVTMALESDYINHGYLFFEGDGTQNYFT